VLFILVLRSKFKIFGNKPENQNYIHDEMSNRYTSGLHLVQNPLLSCLHFRNSIKSVTYHKTAVLGEKFGLSLWEKSENLRKKLWRLYLWLMRQI